MDLEGSGWKFFGLAARRNSDTFKNICRVYVLGPHGWLRASSDGRRVRSVPCALPHGDIVAFASTTWIGAQEPGGAF